MLSEEQKAPINALKEFPGYSFLIPSIAGSGKTFTISEAGNFLVEKLNVDPKSIIFGTFTSSAGKKLKDDSKHDYLFVDTFHSMANSVMNKYFVTTESDSDNRALYQCDEQLREFASFLRSESKESVEFRQQIRYLFIDEYQDNNALMNSVAKSLNRSGTVIVAVGDLKQAIMQFQGGSCDHMLQFENHFIPSKVFQLSVNRRCSTSIVRLARTIKSFGFIHPVYEKEMDKSLEEYEWEMKKVPEEYRVTRSPKPRLRHYFNQSQLIEWSCGSIANKLLRHKPHRLVMIARTNATLKKCRSALLAKGIPCILLRKITNQSKKTNQNTDFDENYKQILEAERLGKVVLATPHAAKGLEWDDGEILEFHDHQICKLKEILPILP
jgi:superfamily I DNA/RNA helicase